MTLLTLTATPEPGIGPSAPLDVTELLTAGALGSNSGVSFSNSGREVLLIQTGAGAGGTTVVVEIGTTVQGQPVTPITLTVAASKIVALGPFPSDVDQPGGDVQITFGTPANVSGLALFQSVGVL